ncbi:hypothetical protein [Thalassolituus sp. UBA3500]|uniref:hypothetical protein n=1 Tax=Thalassolituus sp. UBA3500 TaxID=1947664 RepID=UPI000C1181E3|nr:hypothetical protein [Thalassolituus sp. UBA3500]MBN56449.1 hypothetical protein [Oceanospirillaceae bacterium]|tara:strand:+ start:7954 stop:8499 length:546 start_codon:yes stop_codon:yes gene_type:complete
MSLNLAFLFLFAGLVFYLSVFLYLIFYRTHVLINKIKRMLPDWHGSEDEGYDYFYSLGVTCLFQVARDGADVSLLSFGYSIVIYNYYYLAYREPINDDASSAYANKNSLLASKLRTSGVVFNHMELEDWQDNYNLKDISECILLNGGYVTYFIKLSPFYGSDELNELFRRVQLDRELNERS